MIRVEVEEYCQHCLDFSPDVLKPQRMVYLDGELTYGDTVIQCEYRKRCAGIKRYLEQQRKGEQNAEVL